MLGGGFRHVSGNLFPPEKAHSHLVRAGGSRSGSHPPSPSITTRPDPRGPPLPAQSGLAPAILPARNLCSSSCQARCYVSPRLHWAFPALSSHHSPLHSSAPATHLSTPQHSPCLYHEQVGAGTTPILQSACLSAFRPHVNHTGQTKAQRPLGSKPRGQESWGSFCSIRSQCPLLPHGPPAIEPHHSHLFPCALAMVSCPALPALRWVSWSPNPKQGRGGKTPSSGPGLGGGEDPPGLQVACATPG